MKKVHCFYSPVAENKFLGECMCVCVCVGGGGGKKNPKKKKIFFLKVNW
jgi:hypothetical protein